MRHNSNNHSWSAVGTGLKRTLRAVRRSADYHLIVFMIRTGLLQPAQVRVRGWR